MSKDLRRQRTVEMARRSDVIAKSRIPARRVTTVAVLNLHLVTRAMMKSRESVAAALQRQTHTCEVLARVKLHHICPTSQSTLHRLNCMSYNRHSSFQSQDHTEVDGRVKRPNRIFRHHQMSVDGRKKPAAIMRCCISIKPVHQIPCRTRTSPTRPICSSIKTN